MNPIPPHRCKFSISLHQVSELLMCTLSNHIRETPNWWEEVKDEASVEKWREVALQQADSEEARRNAPTHRGDDGTSRRLTPAMVRSCSL